MKYAAEDAAADEFSACMARLDEEIAGAIAQMEVE